MWDFFSDVRATVRQAVAPRGCGATGEPRHHNQVQQPFASDDTGVGDYLSDWWGTINKTAMTLLQNAFGTLGSDASDEPLPLLLRLSPQQRKALSPDEIIRGVSEAVSVIAIRSDAAHKEACFLLSLSFEEQIAHTSDFLDCHHWWEQLVNRRLTLFQEILQDCKCPPESDDAQTIRLLTQRIHAIRDKCAQDMEAIASRGCILRDERYDALSRPFGSTESNTMLPEDYQIETTYVTKNNNTDDQQSNDFTTTYTLRNTTNDNRRVTDNNQRKVKDNNVKSFHKEKEARHLAEEEARRLAEEEARRLAEEEARRLAEGGSTSPG
ncbi:vesicular transport-associated repeat protein [Trypanosoma rangeli]|uniref:Vesicular transport-associated repeat protein n=1 Tax=Trypanosoma rangeli TaxID=5698 RepID=A0A3R7KLF8_TRYRA|nr:vesicular transport-associated repeat protein [Trypanosoma rangeli]RNE96803.1 vesicular transport-associated repeat protein [Trypanosoma rangeli]|eukprot:RNE96803.1 vesicular transport-associated repeat protein [Trypanosoma rangeli]